MVLLKHKSIISVMLVVFLFSIASCTVNPDVEESFEPSDISDNQPLSGTLRISQCFDFLQLNIAIERFTAIHPDVEIVLNRYNNDWQRYNMQVSAELLAGTADDIIDAALFPFFNFADRGFLVDIYQLMRNDPDFNKDDYFMNVFYGMKYNGGLYAFPTEFGYDVVGVNNMFSDELVEMFRQYDTISYRQLLDLFLGLPDNGGHFLGFNMDVLNIADANFIDFIDLENNTANFDSDEFIGLIEDAKAATNPQKAMDGELGLRLCGGVIPKARLVEHSYNYLFFLAGSHSLQVFFPHLREEVFTHFIPLTTSNGEIMTHSNHQFLINAASENIDLAWEFLKFLTTDEVLNSNISGNIPVKREMVRVSIPPKVENAFNFIATFETAPSESVADISEYVIAILDRYNEMPMRDSQNIHDRRLLGILTEIIIEFYHDFLTAEQAATELQNRISVFLMEQD